MSKTKKIIVYGLMAFWGTLLFFLEVFVFQWPDNAWLAVPILTVLALCAIFGIIGLCSLSRNFRELFLGFLEMLGWVPFD